MRTDILDFHDFYRSHLGSVVRDFISARIREAWGDGVGMAIAGFGYANPYLELFGGAQRLLAFSPGAQGVIRWPQCGGIEVSPNSASLVSEVAWPLPDACLDRLLIVHGLEESPDPHRLMREAWRVLADDGRMVIIVAHRRGLWSMADATPFGAGRPYLKRQLNGLIESSLFRATQWSSALYFPPVNSKLLLRAARAWERAGARLWPGLGGVLMVEASKDMMAPTGLVRRTQKRLLRPAIASPQPVRMGNDAKRTWRWVEG